MLTVIKARKKNTVLGVHLKAYGGSMLDCSGCFLVSWSSAGFEEHGYLDPSSTGDSGLSGCGTGAGCGNLKRLNGPCHLRGVSLEKDLHC